MNLYKGNIAQTLEENPQNKGWIVGSFMSHEALFSEEVEIKWVTRKAGEKRTGSTSSFPKRSMDIVLEGSCIFRFPSHDTEYTLNKGDYIVYDPSSCTHEIEVLTDCNIIVIRTPSKQ